MERFIFTLILAFASFNASAWCSYVDKFHLSKTSNPLVSIQHSNASKEIIMTISNQRKDFELKDAGNCLPGTALASYEIDINHWCKLVIKDGPTFWKPTIISSCRNLSFKGMDLEGNRTYLIHIV